MSVEQKSGHRAVFTHGPIMRHVVVMAATGSVGLMAIFVVDLLSLLYVSWLGDHSLTAAVGYATQLSFFVISISIGLSIAVGALVSRAIGSGDRIKAERLAASCLIHVAIISGIVTIVAFPFRGDLLHLLGARGATLDTASTFLAITLPSTVPLALGMAMSGLLRAAGDARRSMYVTLGGGLVTAIFDPLLIFGMGLGVHGAAITTDISRLAFAAVGAWGCMHVHKLIGRSQKHMLLADLKTLLAIALPVILTNLAAPVSTSYAMSVYSSFGEATIAAVTILDRLVGVGYGSLFALSGAVGPIIGQNLGARLYDRIRRTLIDCFTLAIGYSVFVWAVLWLASPLILRLFSASEESAGLVMFFCRFGALAWVFLGCLFVANAAFNNLGYPTLSTLFNWGRATLGTIPFVTIGAHYWGPEGAMLGIVAGAAIFGTAAVFVAFHVTGRLARIKPLA